MKEQKMSNLKRLHLGCGNTYLEGYINIDFPPSEQTVQKNVKVDMYADIKKLKFAPGSIAEVRLHHVFEHFDRPTALRLLIDWYNWLGGDGLLIIETPDFEKSIKAFLIGGTKTKQKNLRHIFGSHEAHWAIHCDGWYKSKFKLYLQKLGYTDLEFKFNSWQGTHNIVVMAKKRQPYITPEKQLNAAKELLQLSLVDEESASEQTMLQVWLENLYKE